MSTTPEVFIVGAARTPIGKFLGGLPPPKASDLGDATLKDGVVLDGLWCSFNDCHMIELAQYTAEKAKLTRQRIDEFSVKSQHKAAAAQAECRFSKEIVTVSIPQRKGDPVVISK